MDDNFPKKDKKENNKIPVDIINDDQALAAAFEIMTDEEDSAANYVNDTTLGSFMDRLPEQALTRAEMRAAGDLNDDYTLTDKGYETYGMENPDKNYDDLGNEIKEEVSLINEEKNKVFKNDGGKKEKKGLINSIGKAFSSISNKLETNIETMLNDPGKRALFYAGTDMVDKASRITPISSGKAQSPFGQIVSGFGTGVKRVKAEEMSAANAASKASSTNMKNQLEMLKLGLEQNKPSKLEIRSYDNLDKIFEDIQSATSATTTYSQQKKLVKEFAADKNNAVLPVGRIKSNIPLILQSINELLPAGLRQDNKFFEQIETDANFLNSSNKLTNINVLTALSNTKLVPVSDKDLEVVKTTKVSIKDPAQTYLTNLVYQDAINTINAETIAFKDDFIKSRGSKRGSERDFNKELESIGALSTRNKILSESQYDKEQIYEEAKALGFVQSYEKYGNEIVDYSPFALASAKASLDMGGKASYGRFTYSETNDGTGANTTVTGNGEAVDGDGWKGKYPNIKDLSEENKLEKKEN